MIESKTCPHDSLDLDPAEIAEMMPSDTVAILSSDVSQLSVLTVAVSGKIVTVKTVSLPAIISMSSGSSWEW